MCLDLVPPAGFEPAHPPSEGGALSPELRGLSPLGSAGEGEGYQQVVLCSQSRKNTRMVENAYFATGCFWGAQRRFWQLAGVGDTAVGYMGGGQLNPTYEQVCTGVTGHAETVRVSYDRDQISYDRLLEEFWTMHDPTTLNSQGNDVGSQYRSAIFTTAPEQLATALASREFYQAAISAAGYGEIVTEIASAQEHSFWLAEEYHQEYLAKNPNGYDCHSSTGVAYPKVSHE
jgi:peptide-methionine (S)-S-oxide reductase